MLRRLLTCLALITGLATAGMPASAAVSSAMGSEIGASLSVHEADADTAASCSVGDGPSSRKQPAKRECKKPRTITIFIPTVQFGADRAFE